MNSRVRKSVGDFFRPLEEDEISGVAHEFVEPERGEIGARVESIRVNMDEALKALAVWEFVDFLENERRTAYRFFNRKRACNRLGESGLPRPKLARERDQRCRLRVWRQGASECAGFNRKRFDVRYVHISFHAWIVPPNRKYARPSKRTAVPAEGVRRWYDSPMDLPFDAERTTRKLAEVREQEEEDLTRILSEKYAIPYTDLSLHAVDVEALRTIPEEKARAAEAAAFARTAEDLSLAIHNPNNPALAELRTELAQNGFQVREFFVSKKGLDKVLSRYSELSFATKSKTGVFVVAENVSAGFAKGAATRALLDQKLSEAAASKSLEHVSNLLETIFAGAFALRASDIHFEPEEKETRLRLRIDGLLADAHSFDPNTSHQLNSRLKLLSGVKLNVTNRAQDGRFSVSRSSGELEMRASFIPGKYGEAIVLRILDPETTKVSYKELGINPKLLARLEKEIRRSNGMLLTTGPTGSGKTTTLYSFLREIYAPEIKIITIEDPIEYHLSGIVQTQVEDKKYTFAEGLRSIVRQDPDIIMVGEIRDGETANIAIQAALTGHFVFSTLHTNDAAGTFPRLADLGADPKSFGSAVTVSMAQRLLRKLDPDTKKERPLTDEEKRIIEKVFDSLADKTLIPEKIETVWEAAPAHAEETGYKGRIGLYEAIFMDDELAEFLRDNPPANEIAKVAAKKGYLTMAQDGILKALAGITSLSEVAATVDLPQ